VCKCTKAGGSLARCGVLARKCADNGRGGRAAELRFGVVGTSKL